MDKSKNVSDIFSIEGIVDDHKVMDVFAKFEVYQQGISDSFSDFVWRIALRHNDPAKPAISAKEFQTYMEDLEQYTISSAAGTQNKNFKLSGNNAISNAYRKCLQGLKNKFDLSLDKYDTAGKIGLANTAKKKADVKEADVQAVITEIKDIMKEEGIEEGTPAWDEEFNKRRLALVPESDDSKKKEEEAPKDDIRMMADSIELKLRQLKDAGVSPKELQDKVNAALVKWDEALTKVLSQATQLVG